MAEKELKSQYAGIIKVGNTELPCYVLDNGDRVLSTRGIMKSLGRTWRGRKYSGTELPVFIEANNLKPFIDEDSREVLTPIFFRTDTGSFAEGFKAEILPLVCETYLKANDENALTESQKKVARNCEVLIRAFARVGIIALIDEATGYQFDRKYDALRVLLQHYIAEGIQKWTKRFPDKFFEELDRLYENPKTTSRSRPQYYGKFINAYVYEPIENGYVKEELNKLNITDDNKRKAKFHQWLSDFGVNQLQLQIGRVMGLLEVSPNMRKFKSMVARQSGLSLIQLDLFEDS
jgi:hypothetical protein